MSQVVSTCNSLDHPCIEGLIVINAKHEQKLALFTQKSYSPTNLSNIYCSPTTVNSKQKDVTGPPHSLMLGGGKCQDMLRWSGQNANQKVDPDKMPTTEKKSRTKCQPRLAFCPVGILSTHHFNNGSIFCNDCLLSLRN